MVLEIPSVSVRVSCPHCRTTCLVAEQHLGKPVQCGRCARTFTTRGEQAGAAPVRLDIGVATSPGRVRPRNEDSFLVQHLVWCNLDQRHEVAVLIVADGMGGAVAGDRVRGLVIRAAGAALAPLLADVLNGSAQDASAVSEAITACKGVGAAVAVAVVWDGRVHVGRVGDCRVYQQRGGRLTQILRDQTLVLAAGDWLVLACDGRHAHLDENVLQTEIARAVPSAVQVAQQLVERADQLGGSDNCTVVVARCY